MNAEQKRNLLAKFCANQDDIRYYLQSPIRQNGCLFATNGHVMVRVEDDPDIEAPTGGEKNEKGHVITSVATLFDKTTDDNFQPLAIDLPPKPDCLSCSGSGTVYGCPECDGDGEFDHGNHTYDCKECDGGGLSSDDAGDQTQCTDCQGTGKNDRTAVVFHGRTFMRRYIELIQSLDQPELTVPAHDHGIAKFRFVGGEGLLMPMRA